MLAGKQAGRTALFAPWGNGSGHLVRMLALATQARADGWEVTVLVMNERQASMAAAAGLTAVLYSDSFPALDPWRVWQDETFWVSAVGHDRIAIRAVNPDVVVADSRLSLTIASALEGRPLLNLIQDMDFPGYSYPGRPTEDLWAGISAALRGALHRLGFDSQAFDDPRNLWMRAGVAVPGSEDSDDVPAGCRVDAYLGPLTGAEVSPHAAPLDDAEGAPLLFYKTVGSNADLESFADAFSDVISRVFISTGNPDETRILGRSPSLRGARVADFWSISPHTCLPAAAVIHGGHGTLLQMASLGVPTLVAPDLSPERFANAVKADSISSMSGLTSHISPSSLSWDNQGNPQGTHSFHAMRRQLDALLGSPELQHHAQLVADTYADFNPARAWGDVVQHARIPFLLPAGPVE